MRRSRLCGSAVVFFICSSSGVLAIDNKSPHPRIHERAISRDQVKTKFFLKFDLTLQALRHAPRHDQVAKADAGTGSRRACYLREEPASLIGAHEFADVGEAEAVNGGVGLPAEPLLRG